MNRLAAEAVFLDRGAAPTLQGQLAAGLVRVILDNRVPAGTRLPSSRSLAQHLGVSRLTVTLVYQELMARGFVEGLARSGYRVSASVPHRRLVQPWPQGAAGNAGQGAGQGVDWSAWIAREAESRRVIRKPANWADYLYPFIFGQPDPLLFDHAAWRDCVMKATGRRDFNQLAADQFGRDDPMLVDYICSHSLPRRGIAASPDQVLITLGAQNALYLAIGLLARPDRLAVMEEPGYPDFAETLRRSDCPVHFQPTDGHGLDPETLPPGTALVMVTPSHHIPTGATMPLARRRALLDKAARDDFLMIEDDYDFEMSYLAPPEPSLKSLDAGGRVIYVGSFSKSLFPGLRIGYMVGPAPFIAAARRLRSSMLRHPPSHLQRITAYFLALGHYDAHIVRLRHALSDRRAAVMAALQSARHLTLAGAARSGGSSVWLSAPAAVDSGRLAEALRSESVLIEPGAVFFEAPSVPCPFFRLGYGSIPPERIAAGIALIDAAAGRLAH